MVGKLTPDDILSASVIPAALGYSPFKSRNALLRDMIAASEGRYESDFTGNEATHWGDTLEPVILEEAARRLNITGLRTTFDAPFMHKNMPLAASLDGAGQGQGVLHSDSDNGIYVMGRDEIDITGRVLLESKLTSNQPETSPPLYRGPLQVQAQMMCTGAKTAVICTLYRGITLRLFVYRENPEIQQRIANAVEEFERRKRDKDFFPPDDAADAAVANSTVDADAPVLDLNKHDDMQNALAEIVAARVIKEAAEQRIDAAQAKIIDHMGAHTRAEGLVGNTHYSISRPMRNYAAKPERVVPAKPARSVRQSTLTIKERTQ